ncbi:MAG: hypothetical protein HY815_11460 [Candidatus Riflebacteria bacterium]|nr:hypothetical protein [Candidatus Riflebacteria bacterium]
MSMNRMLERIWRVLMAGVLVVSPSQGAPPGSSGPAPGPEPSRLLEQARQANPERYRFALARGARIGYTRDGSTFYLLWTPPGRGADRSPGPVIATLHGHASYAFDELFLWHRQAAARGIGILALQWWKGRGERFQDYLLPREIYRALDDALREAGVRSGQVMLHGFSRGSANSYAVTAIDRQTRNNYFALVVANAGKPGRDFPDNVDLERGRFGPRPLTGTNWVLYCGMHDPNPDRAGCQGMAEVVVVTHDHRALDVFDRYRR